MSLRRYIATGRGAPHAALAVFGVSLLAGVITGAVESVISRWFSLVVLFPMLIGGAAGGTAVVMIGRRKLRAPTLAFVLGVLGGTGGYVTLHIVDYVQSRSAIADALLESDLVRDTPDTPDDPVDVSSWIDTMLVRQSGHSGFIGYLLVRAQEGVTIKRAGTSDPGLELRGTWAWVLWAVELLLASITAGVLARNRAKEPFCESCDQWFGLTHPIAAGAPTIPDARRALIRALESGELDAAATALALPPANEWFVLRHSACPTCNSESYCTLEQITVKKNKQHKAEIARWLMTRDELSRFIEAIARAQARVQPGIAAQRG